MMGIANGVFGLKSSFCDGKTPAAMPPQGKCYKRSCHHQWSGSQENATIIDGRTEESDNHGGNQWLPYDSSVIIILLLSSGPLQS